MDNLNLDTKITGDNLAKSSAQTVPQNPTQNQTFVDSVNAGLTGDYLNTLQNGGNGLDSLSTLKSNQATAENNLSSTDSEIQNLMKELGYQNTDRTALEGQYGIADKTSEVNDLKTQYATAKANFDTIAKQVAGQAIPSIFAGGQLALQQSIAATQLGGIAAQIQVAQGNLKTAQDTVDRTINNKYNAIKDNLEAQLKYYTNNYTKFSDAQQKVADREIKILEAKKSDADNKYEEEKNAIDDIVSSINSGKITPTSGYNAINQLMNGKITTAQAYGALHTATAVSGSGVYTPGQNPAVDSWVKNIQNGTAKISNVPAALKNAVSLALSQTTAQTAQNSGVLDALNTINQMFANPKLGNITGPIGQYTGGLFGEAATAKNQYNFVKSFLSLENRQKLKGQGAVSDFEGKMLAEASTALGRNLNETEFRKQLATVKGVLTTASGGEANVVITDKKTGQKKAGLADRQTINDAIADDYIVEYSE